MISRKTAFQRLEHTFNILQGLFHQTAECFDLRLLRLLLSLFPPVLCQPANHADFIGTKNYEGRAIPQNGEFPPETLFLQCNETFYPFLDIVLYTPYHNIESEAGVRS